MNRKRAILVLLLLVLLIGTFHGSVFPQDRSEGEESRFENISTAMEVIALVKTRHYQQPINTLDMISAYVQKGTINGMLRETMPDDYTRYMDAHAFDRMMTNTRGVYGGIGIVVGIQEERLTVVSPIKGTPGDRAGLRGGDKIMAIDGKDTTYMTLDEAVSLMRGPEGEEINLTIQRGEETQEVHIVRAIINVESVPEPELLEGDIGYVQITNFSERTYEELVAALDSLEAQNAQALILDLRFNPGGTLNAALEVSNEFISSGPLVYLEDKDGKRSAFEASFAGTRQQLPMVILINGSSASASEIVAGALQDNELAILIGEQTFGKGLVQSLYPLRDGSAVTITEQAYLTSGGRNIHEVGIEPDILVELTDEEEEGLYLGDEDVEDIQLNKAIEVLLEKLAK